MAGDQLMKTLRFLAQGGCLCAIAPIDKPKKLLGLTVLKNAVLSSFNLRKHAGIHARTSAIQSLSLAITICYARAGEVPTIVSRKHVDSPCHSLFSHSAD